MQTKTLRLKRALRATLIVLLMGVAGMTKAQTENIVFDDVNVKALCVANWDINGDGELSYAEAAMVADLGEVFRENSIITTFDELQYFTGLTSIGNDSFENCMNLTSIVFPNSINSIGIGVFWYCNKLSSVIIPNSVNSIGYLAFANSGITSITIPASVTTIAFNAFNFTGNLETIVVESGNAMFDSRNGCNAIIETGTNILKSGCKNTIIPNTVVSIGEDAFIGCSGLLSIDIPSSVTSIGYRAFGQCYSLTDISIPNSVVSMGWGVFQGCNHASSITIGSSLATIGASPFEGCSNVGQIEVDSQNIYFDSRDNCNAIIETATNELVAGCKNTIIPSTVTSIRSFAFQEMTNLTSIVIPASVRAIGRSAFRDCSGLTSITILAETPPALDMNDAGVFYNVDKTIPLYVPAGSITVYQSAEGWSEFTNIQELENCPIPITFADANVKALCVANWDTNGDGELSYAEAAAVTDLGEVFRENSTVTTFDELQYFTGLTFIGDFAFFECESLTSIEIPNSVAFIGDETFYYCSSLTSIKVFANTPPVLGTDVFFDVDKSIPVYVLAGTISAYQVAEGWGEFTNFQELGNSPIPIIFADVNVKALCVANWDINGDGELSYAEAAMVADLGEVFENNTTITSFDELRYFNGLVSIGYNAFHACESLTSIEIPSFVTCIGVNAFANCIGLSSIEIPNSVISIESDAFYGCRSLTSIEIPNSVTSIGAMAFYECESLTSIKIPNSVTSIGYSAFEHCWWLTSIEIPNSMASIEDEAFSYCSSLTSIKVFANTPPILGTNVFFDVDKSIPVYVPAGTISTYQAAEGWSEFTYYIEPQPISENIVFADADVKAICVTNWDVNGDGELSYAEAAVVKDLKQVFRGHGITSFDELQYFTGLTSIGDFAFYLCESLTSIEIPNSVTSIGNDAFAGCIGLTGELTIPNSVITIGYSAFGSCSGFTGDLVIPNSVTTIGGYAFSGCSGFTGNLTIPNSVTSIGNGAFSGCSGFNGSLTIGNSVTSIGEYAFSSCSGFTGNLTIPNAVNSIGNHAFSSCRGFNGCLTIGNSVSSIGTYAFAYCGGFESIVVTSENSNYDSRDNCNAIIETSSNTLVCGCKNSSIPNTVTSIGDVAFGRVGLTGDLVLPNSLITIGNNAFFLCDGLSGSLIIPNSVTTIGEDAFYHCGFNGLTIGSSVSQIGQSAFGNMDLSYIVSNAETPPSISANTFWHVNHLVTSIPVYIPCGSLSSYESAAGWNSFSNFYESDYGFVVGIFEIPGIEGNASIIQFPICSSNMTMTTVHAEPSWGYNFTGWYVDGNLVSTNPDYTFELMEDVILEARFERASNYYEFVGGGSDNRWDNPENWDTQELPSSTSTVGIWSDVEINTNVNVNSAKIFDGYTTLTIKPNVVFAVSGTFELSEYSSLIMEEGAQVVHSNEGVRATLKKSISPFTQGLSDGWHLIASPIVGNTAVTSVGNLLSNDYDFFYFDEPSRLWKNYSNPNNDFTELKAGKGYLYANCGSDFKPEGTRVGEGTSTTDYFPFYTYYEYTISENLFLATELEEAGLDTEPLGSLCWYATNAPGYAQRNIRIWMANVNDEALTSTSHLTSGMTLVYTGNMTPVLGWNEFIFNENTFSWDGTSNVLICVQRNDGEYNNIVNWQCHNTGFVAQSYRYNMYNEYDMDNSTYSMNTVSVRANTIFQHVDEAGQGTYLPVTLSFTGEIENGSATVNVPLSYTEAVGSLAGFNLVGNPFVHKVTSYGSTNVAEGCYRLNDLRDNLIVSTISESHPLKPAEGFLVKATAEGASITFNPSRGTLANHNGFIFLEISENGKTIDRIIVKNEGEPLEKLSLKENGTKVYAMHGNQEMAIVSREGNEQPVSFKASKNGTYTISMEMENVTLDYMHLIDNMTGADIDLLQTPEYTFTAKTTDYESRFRLLFDANENGASIGSATFAYYADGEIRLVVETQDFASLQIVDVMGRVCREMLASPNYRVSTAGMTPGMYVLRLIEDDNVKTQKIVVQ